DVSVAPAWAKRCALGTADGASIEITEEPQVIRLSSPSLSAPAGEMTQQQKIAAALVKAGISSPGAWTAAGLSVPPVPAQVGTKPVAPAATARSSSGEAKSGSGTECFDLHPSVVLMKGTHDPTFFISWRSQREILASLGWKSTLMIWGGPAVTLASLYVLLAHFG